MKENLTKEELLSNSLTLQLIWKHNFKKCMLIEWKKTDNEIDKYICFLENFIADTLTALQNQFTFLNK